MPFRYFLWYLYVFHKCEVCAVLEVYPILHHRMVSKFIQPEAAIELKTMPLSKNNALCHRKIKSILSSGKLAT